MSKTISAIINFCLPYSSIKHVLVTTSHTIDLITIHKKRNTSSQISCLPQRRRHQVKSICCSAHFHIRNINAIRHLLTLTAAGQIVHSLVTSHLDYCNALLHRVPASRIKPLQRVQNIAARVVTLCLRTDHIEPILK